MKRALQVTPWFLEPVLVFGWTMVFFAIAKTQRRAVEGNLCALHPSWGNSRARVGAWQVFWNFAATLVDAQRCESGTGALDWTVEGLEAFEDLAHRTEGCILLTAHMGNYDIAAAIFASKFKRTLYAVRAPEREPETQLLREQEIHRKEALHPNFRTLYNSESSHLGVELARLLREGNIVAVQADRVIFDISPMTVEVEPELLMTIPKGPLFLARATGAPCFPLVILRAGWRHYRIVAMPRLEIPRRPRNNEDPATFIWADTIFQIVRRNWRQWYVFEPILNRKRQNQPIQES